MLDIVNFPIIVQKEQTLLHVEVEGLFATPTSVTRSESRRFPQGGLKFPQSFPTFENLLPLYGNFPKIHKIEQNLMIIST